MIIIIFVFSVQWGDGLVIFIDWVLVIYVFNKSTLESLAIKFLLIICSIIFSHLLHRWNRLTDKMRTFNEFNEKRTLKD